MLLGASSMRFPFSLGCRSTRRRFHAAPFRGRQTIWKMVVLQSELLSCVMRRRVKVYSRLIRLKGICRKPFGMM